MKAPHIILAAGGTGGHMMPAEAVAEILNERGYQVSIITDKRGDAIENAFKGMEKTVLKASSHMGGGLWGKVKSAISLALSFLQVRSMFSKIRPTVVVGFGGYPSLPAVMAAKNLSIPYVLHEQNAVLGRVNRMMAKDALFVALTFEETTKIPQGTKVIMTGNPVRRLIAKLANIAYAVPFGFGDIRLFVIGGSQGARILSDVVPYALATLSEENRGRVEVAHQARPEDIDRVRAVYNEAGIKAVVSSYFNDVGAVLLRTHLVISRSGASTLAELMAMGRPAILVPLAIAADDHQMMNAKIMADAGGAWLMKESEFTIEALREKLEGMFEYTGGLRDGSDAMREIANLGAAEDLTTLIMHVCDGEELP